MPKPKFQSLEPITTTKAVRPTTTAANRLPGTYSTEVPAVHLPSSPDISRAASQHFLQLAANPNFDSSLQDITRDTEGDADPRPVTIENLPTVINSEVATDVKFRPTWYQVAKLPGNIKRGIAQLGKDLFSQFTSTPTDKIWTMTTLTNPVLEVKAVFAWIKQHAHKIDTIEIDFNVFSGYTPDVELWMHAGIEFLLVKDFAGYYIYSWPANNMIAGSGSNLQQHLEQAKGSGKPLREALEEQFIQQYISLMEDE